MIMIMMITILFRACFKTIIVIMIGKFNGKLIIMDSTVY